MKRGKIAIQVKPNSEGRHSEAIDVKGKVFEATLYHLIKEGKGDAMDSRYDGLEGSVYERRIYR